MFIMIIVTYDGLSVDLNIKISTDLLQNVSLASENKTGMVTNEMWHLLTA